jgi:hypothetical protein
MPATVAQSHFANSVVSPIVLASELAIDKNLTIQGPGANLLTISGNNASRVFNIGSVTPAINVTLSGLMIADGGVIGDSGAGGGIANNTTGALTITGSTVSGNTVTATGGGGLACGAGIYNNFCTGTLTITNSTIGGNTVTATGNGGLAFAGGIYNNGGAVIVTNSAISGNNTASINGRSSGGAGIYSYGGPLTITNSTISGNTITTFGAAFGAGIAGNTGIWTIVNSTIAGNTATSTGNIALGAGILCDNSGLTITNSTISGNTAEGYSSAQGGGVYNYGIGIVTITNGTISGNTTTSTHSTADGGGIFNHSNTVNALNTIVAGNTAATSGPDLRGSFTSQGHNLIGKGDSSTGFVNGVNGDQVGSIASPLDPKLGPLQNNGGLTLTMALLTGSSAINAGDDSVTGNPLDLATDQRGAGFPRKVGTHVDIGAFEFTFDTCLRDNTTGNLLQFSSTNGQYLFTRCSEGFTLSGTGVVRLVNGILTLTDSKPDRRVSAGFLTQKTGSATIYLMVAPGVWQTFRINATNPAAVCSCPVSTGWLPAR